MNKTILFMFLLVVPLEAFAVREIPDPKVSDIAITAILNGEVVIIYNPDFCQKMGSPMCNFFRAHEYGHVNLNHPVLKTHPQQAEYEADCWAAKNAPLTQVQFAYNYFMNEGFMGDWSHGTGFQRAQRLAACAQSRIDWLSNAKAKNAIGSKDHSAHPSNPQVLNVRARLEKLSSEIYFLGKYSENRYLLFKDKDPCEITFYEKNYYPDSSPTFDLKSTIFFAKSIDFERVPISYKSERFINEYLSKNPLGSKYHHITEATTFLPDTEQAYIPEITISDVQLKYWALQPIVGEGKVEKASEYGHQDWLSFSSESDRNSYFDLLIELRNSCLTEDK